MKTIIVLLLGSVLLVASALFGQQPDQPVAVAPQVPARKGVGVAVAEQPKLTKFNLDFRGGRPADLLKAIEKGLGKPINAIVPDEYADLTLPALKMTGVDVAELFQALMLATAKTVHYYRVGAPGNQQAFQSSYGFRTTAQPSDDAVWYFIYEKPPVQPEYKDSKVCILAQLKDES